MVEPDPTMLLHEKSLHLELSKCEIWHVLQQGFFRRQIRVAKVVRMDNDAAFVSQDSPTVWCQLEIAQRAGPVGMFGEILQ
jgi:hypothetical protein